PGLGGAVGPVAFGPNAYSMKHTTESVNLSSSQTYSVNVFAFTEVPSKANEHAQGIYLFRLASTDVMTAHLYCKQGPGMFRVDDSGPLPSFVFVEERFQIGRHAGANNMLTVASYNSEAPGQRRPVDDTSSHGPLTNYGDPTLPPPPKPDIAA